MAGMNLMVLLMALDPVPKDDDVKAGWVAFGIFIAMAVAVALLGWSLVRHLRKTGNNANAGVFDESDEPKRSRSH